MEQKKRKSPVGLTLQQRGEIIRLCDQQVKSNDINISITFQGLDLQTPKKDVAQKFNILSRTVGTIGCSASLKNVTKVRLKESFRRCTNGRPNEAGNQHDRRKNWWDLSSRVGPAWVRMTLLVVICFRCRRFFVFVFGQIAVNLMTAAFGCCD